MANWPVKEEERENINKTFSLAFILPEKKQKKKNNSDLLSETGILKLVY